jgi:hypothetical protein
MAEVILREIHHLTNQKEVSGKGKFYVIVAGNGRIIPAPEGATETFLM